MTSLDATIQQTVAGLGYQLWGCEASSAGGRKQLKVFIDQPEGVSVEACMQVSRQLKHVLKAEGGAWSEVLLEVSSPGLDRALFTVEQCAGYIGHVLKLSLVSPIEGRRHWRATLLAVNADKLHLRAEDQELTINFSDIRKVKLDSELY